MYFIIWPIDQLYIRCKISETLLPNSEIPVPQRKFFGLLFTLMWPPADKREWYTWEAGSIYRSS